MPVGLLHATSGTIGLRGTRGKLSLLLAAAVAAVALEEASVTGEHVQVRRPAGCPDAGQVASHPRTACSAGTALFQHRTSLERIVLTVEDETEDSDGAAAKAVSDQVADETSVTPAKKAQVDSGKVAEQSATPAMTLHSDDALHGLVSANLSDNVTKHTDHVASMTWAQHVAVLLANLGEQSKKQALKVSALRFGRTIGTGEIIASFGLCVVILTVIGIFVLGSAGIEKTPRADRANATYSRNGSPVLPSTRVPLANNLFPFAQPLKPQQNTLTSPHLPHESAAAQYAEFMRSGTHGATTGKNLDMQPAGLPGTSGGATMSRWPSAVDEDRKNLCPALMVPAGCECVLIALRQTKGGTLDIKDKSGRVVLRAVNIGLYSLELCTATGEPMARCNVSGEPGVEWCEFNILWPWGEQYGTLSRGHAGDDRYILDFVGGNRLSFFGDFKQHCVNVTDDDGRLLATAEPVVKTSFDPSGDYFNVRVAPFVDAGLMLSCILCLTNLSMLRLGKEPG